MKTVLTIPDILERYQIGRQSLWRWRKSKNFPPSINPCCARPFWSIKDIEQWERSNAA
jgi:predicted DNA-binding transcriptional regulator AlpA